MATVIQDNFNVRKTYSKIKSHVQIPNLIDIQKKSYEAFLQMDVAPEKRQNVGLQAVFKGVFPIKNYDETASLDFVKYDIDKPKYDVDECRQRGMTYAAPMKVTIRLIIFDKDEVTGMPTVHSVKEQEVYFGEIPLMNEHGTFIINGTERVVVSQLHRSPGVFFTSDQGKTHALGKILYSARIIPYRGSWLDFEFDHKDLIHVRIDRRRKLPATILLKALGYTVQQLLDFFYQKETINIENKGVISFNRDINEELLIGQRVSADVLVNGEVIVKKNRKFTKLAIKKLAEKGVTALPLERSEVIGKTAATDIIDPATGEILLECNQIIDDKTLDRIIAAKVAKIETLFIDDINVGPYIRDTLNADKVENEHEAILEIYRRMRPGEPPTDEEALHLFENLFFNPERYDLSRVGRLKLNYKFNIDEPIDNVVLTKRDILEVVKYLIELKEGRGSVDDIDHLGNRRVRAVGELIENQFRIGLVRMERIIRERISLIEIETNKLHDLINPKPVGAVIKEFFGSSQLSQFMDQNNPLSEITHKRRLSALGPGGLTRDRAGFEVRDVHPTHYGRICPIETPEGANIGLIASLSAYARVNEYGFVETPYHIVENECCTDKYEFLNALQEEKHVIAQANAQLDEHGHFVNELVSARKKGEFIMARREDVTLMDVSPTQLVSVAASLIPFLENDDANRALMGSNMQRQAVPLLKNERPIVGTGMEGTVAHDSGVTILAKRDGIVESVDATRIVVKATSADDETDVTNEVDIYNLTKFMRSNQSTCINQKPIVQKGDIVHAGDVIADGPATDCGELSLGKNIRVAFMPWQGYNYEDSILLSEELLRKDAFTSIHIEEFECIARDTKLGKEEITRDIPNVGDDALRNLDESGIIRIGAEVVSGDILVGKITPKGETQLSPEEKLLRAIFGEKAGDVRDTSLRVPPGVTGIIIGAKIFARKGVEKDERAQQIEDEEEARLLKDRNDEIKIIRDSVRNKIHRLLDGQIAANKLVDEKGRLLLKKGQELTPEVVDTISNRYLQEISTGNADIDERLRKVLSAMNNRIELVKLVFNERIAHIKKGDDLPPGVIKMVKVFVAIKRKLQVGDKMAGRHGNKGVVSRILPVEDMPYLSDGTPVQMVLNPLGVPSRMNIGQILEVHLGWGASQYGDVIQRYLDEHYGPDAMRKELVKIYGGDESRSGRLIKELDDDSVMELCRRIQKTGLHIATPVFDGAHESDLNEMLKMTEVPPRAQSIVFDGRTGEPFDQDITVGIMYMLKLHHLVDDKIHARSIGPYSLVTQQPLGGKAQFGGQRLGEMEVWAIEAYGAAYSLQEFLTVKSDDVSGRTRMYEAIVKGDNSLESGLPESFNVLVKEMQSLSLNVELLNGSEEEENGKDKSEKTPSLEAAAS